MSNKFYRIESTATKLAHEPVTSLEEAIGLAHQHARHLAEDETPGRVFILQSVGVIYTSEPDHLVTIK